MGCIPVSYTHLDVYKRQPENTGVGLGRGDEAILRVIGQRRGVCVEVAAGGQGEVVVTRAVALVVVPTQQIGREPARRA